MSTFANSRHWTGEMFKDPPWHFARLRSSTFIRNVGVLSSGTAVGHLFTLAAAPVLTRLYGPADFGALGLFSSFLSVMTVAVCLRYEVSIPSGENETEAAYLTLACLLFAVPASIVAGASLWILIRYSALGFGTLPLHTVPLLALAMCFVGVFTALRYWCLREKRFVQVSQGIAAQSAGRAAFQVAFGAIGLHPSGLLLGEATGRGIGMSRMFRSAWPVLRSYARRFDLHQLRHALWRNRKFPLYSMPSSFLDALCLSLPVPLLIRLYGSSVGGHYSLVWKAVGFPSVLLTVAIGDTFHSHLAACVRESPDEVMGLFKRTSLGLFLIGAFPALVLFLWGVPLFRFAFGSEWALSGAIAATIAPWYFCGFVVGPVSRVVLVLSGQEMKLVWDMLSVVSLLTVFFTAERYGMELLKTIRILAVVNVALHAIYFLVLILIVARFRQSNFRVLAA